MPRRKKLRIDAGKLATMAEELEEILSAIEAADVTRLSLVETDALEKLRCEAGAITRAVDAIFAEMFGHKA